MADPSIGIIMGSTSDWETMRHAAETLADAGGRDDRPAHWPVPGALPGGAFTGAGSGSGSVGGAGCTTR